MTKVQRRLTFLTDGHTLRSWELWNDVVWRGKGRRRSGFLVEVTAVHGFGLGWVCPGTQHDLSTFILAMLSGLRVAVRITQLDGAGYAPCPLHARPAWICSDWCLRPFRPQPSMALSTRAAAFDQSRDWLAVVAKPWLCCRQLKAVSSVCLSSPRFGIPLILQPTVDCFYLDKRMPWGKTDITAGTH